MEKVPVGNRTHIFIVFIFAGLLVGLVIIAGYLVSNRDETRIRQEQGNTMQLIGNLKVAQLMSWQKERHSDAAVLARMLMANRSLQNWLTSLPAKNFQDPLLADMEYIRNSNDYEATFIVSSEGKALLSAGKSVDQLEDIPRQKVGEALRLHQVVDTDLYYSSEQSKIYYDVIAPLLDAQGNPQAAVVLRVNPYRDFYSLVQSWPVPSKSAETLLVRKDGDYVLFLNELRFQQNTALQFRIPLTDKQVPAVKAVSGYSGIFEGKDYRGVAVLADLRAVPGTTWRLVTKVDESEIFSDLYYREVVNACITLGLALLILVCAGWYLQRRQREYFSSLYIKERDLHQAQEEFRTTLYSIGDAVITTDTNGILRRMNPVAEHLTGWSEAEAQQHPLASVFQIISEETRAISDDPVSRVLREGMVVGLANHTLLISRDGSERPIADSAAPIRDQSGNINGVVMIFRDQTEQRTTQKAIAASEERYRALYESINDGMALHEVIYDDQHQPIDYRIIDVNPQFEKITNLPRSAAIGALATQLYDSKTAPYLDIYAGVVSSGIPVAFEAYFTPMKRYFQISAFSPQPSQFATVFQDITARKQADNERETTIHLLSLLNTRNNTRELIKSVTTYLKNWSRCDAVGIRLQDGEDYPYYEVTGFPQEFVEKERYLCERDRNGLLKRDKMGHPFLECMCGNILCGRFDPTKPFFTEHGSFWSNCTTELLRTTSETDRQGRTRNRCNGEGYESVALIPLRTSGVTFGLIQLNDRKKDHFTPEFIQLMERMADNLSIGLAQRQAQRALHENEASLSSLINNTDGIIWAVDRDLRLVASNKKFNDYMIAWRGYPFNKGENILYDVPPERVEQWTGFYNRALACEYFVVELEAKYYQPARWNEYHLSPLYNQNGDIQGVTVYGRDITSRKESEKQIQTDLREKETLLRELYHRTKNNMQVICSLLDLNSEYTNSNEVKTTFGDMRNRIQAMALVHQKLYQAKDLSRIDLQEYVTDLTTLIQNSYNVASSHISLRLELEPALTTIDTAIPFGLIINELLINSYKHAFPGERNGEIVIRVSLLDDDRLMLYYADNGVGVPAGFDFRSQQTLGIQTIYALVEHQLQGKLEFDSSRGLAVTISLPLSLYPLRV